ncbi:MAG: glycosyltransferase family 2 protein, partial [Gammaproteobacteria bacterium]
MPAPRVSILLPVRNAADRLGPCLDSIAAQTLRDYELLCIDDHSCDGTRALLVARSRRDPRLRILDSPGRGIVAALNHGLVHARGAFIARMDADDRMHRERLARQWAFLRAHPELELVGSRVRILPAGASTTG